MSAADHRLKFMTLLSVLAALCTVGGIVLWHSYVGGVDGPRAWRALLINFLFFSSLSGGLVVWPAVVRACNGRWPGHLERIALSAVVFSIPSLAALILLWFGSDRWSPWHHASFHQGGWLNNTFIFSRDLAALALFWLIAARYVFLRTKGNATIWGGLLIVSYSLVFSLLGFDLVMALDPHWYSTLLGGYFSMSGLYIAIAGWSFLAVWQPLTRGDQLHDLGRLTVGFSLMTTYLMYAHLLPMWYENLPEETRFLVPRLNFQPGLSISYTLLALVYLGPLVLLLPEKSKRSRWWLGGVCLLILCGMWIERWWLVAPVFDAKLPLGLIEISMAVSFTGLLGIGIDQFHRRLPADFLTSEDAE